MQDASQGPAVGWQPELDELAQRRQLALQMGGPEKLQRHRDAGRLPVRERIELLLDPGTFRESGGLAGAGRYTPSGGLADFTPSNMLVGRGRINEQPVVVTGDDFTVRGGANDGAVGDKLIYGEQMAHELRIPLVRLVDGTGGGGSVKNIETRGHTVVPSLKAWPLMTRNLSTIPVVSLGLGSVAGLGAARVCASHYSVMVRETSQLFSAGPPVVARIGENLTKNELGGSQIHTRNGVVDDEAATEHEAIARARRFLSYLPPSVYELPARSAATVARADQTALRTVIPRNPRVVYKVRGIVETLVDTGTFMEIGRHWGKAVVTGLGRIDGWPVAVIASDPYHYGGALDGPSADKYARMVDLAQLFHLPVLNLVDIPGFKIGLDAETSGVIRSGTRALAAIAQTTVPWCSILLRKCFGLGGAAHTRAGRFSFRYAWPSAQWGSLPVEGGLEVAYKAEIEAAADPAAKRQEIEERVRALGSPFRTAEAFLIEDIIDPAETRTLLEEFVALAATRREPGPSSFGYRP